MHTPLPRRGLNYSTETGSARCLEKRSAQATAYAAAAPRSQIIHRDRSCARGARRALQPPKKMADRDDAMDVGAIEDDALNDDDEQDENGDEVEEGYKMV